MNPIYKEIIEKHKPLLDELEEAVIIREFNRMTHSTKGIVKNVENIINYWCKEYGVQLEDLESGSRIQVLKMTRFCIWWSIRNKIIPNELTCQAMGAIFNRHHASVIHGIKQVDAWIEYENELRNRIMMMLTDFGYRCDWDTQTKKLTWLRPEELYAD